MKRHKTRRRHPKCRKKEFTTKGAAQRALNGITSDEHHRDKTPCRYYFCDVCSNYHLTTVAVFNSESIHLKYIKEWLRLIK